jgi:predicted metal-dependent phosphoesterase TrpH
MSGVAAAVAAAGRLGMVVIPGIELTSIHQGKDVHVLAYFLPPSTPGLAELLERQRRLRRERAAEIARRLAAQGAPIDMASLLDATAASGKSLARPQIAQALVAAGYVESDAEAFDRFLGEHRPAYVPHEGASPHEVVAFVSARGGVASLAHPGYRPRDEIIPGLIDAGLSALEVYHSAHDPSAQEHYLQLSRRYGLLATGGSDYHGEGTRRAEFFGVIGLPQADLEALVAHAAARRGRAVEALGTS